MAKKKAPQANGAAANGHTPKIRSNTVQAVKDCLDKGIESPSKIVEVLKKRGIEATPNYVSVIKGEYRKGGKKKGKKGRKLGRPAKTAPQAAAAQSTAPVKRSTGLSPQDLAGLAELVDRAGSAESLRAYLDVLSKVR